MGDGEQHDSGPRWVTVWLYEQVAGGMIAKPAHCQGKSGRMVEAGVFVSCATGDTEAADSVKGRGE